MLGIRGNILSWIKSFLTGREHRVMVNGALSEWVEVSSGIPQGSVLGPLLFTRFVCDVPDLENYISMFVDDTKIFQVLEEHGIYCSLQDDIERLQSWANKMQMLFNHGKCKVMHLGPNNPQRSYWMTTHENPQYSLTAEDQEKDLGVTVDHRLQFFQHVQTQVNKANRVLGALKHIYSHGQHYLPSSVQKLDPAAPRIRFSNLEPKA